MSKYTTEVRWICESIYDNGTIPTETKSYTPTYERGGIDEHGLDVNSNSLLRTNYIKFYDSINNILNITFPNDVTIYYYEYSLQGSYNFLSSGRLTSGAGLFINKNYYYRFVVITDILAYLENITYTYKIAEERTPNNIVKEVHNKVFNFPYEFYSDVTEDINKFEKQFLLYYYTREICEESVGLWKLRLQNELNLIMPKYKELYKTLQLEYNPLFDVDYWRENDTDKNGVSGYRTNYVYTPRVETTNTNARKIEENESRIEQNKNKIDESKISNEEIARANERDVNSSGVSGYQTNHVYTPRVETTNTNARKVEENESRIEQNKNRIDESKISNEEIARANERDVNNSGVSGYQTNHVYTPRVETTNTNARKVEENESRTEQNKNKIDESKITNEGITRANERDINKSGVSERTDNGTRIDTDSSTDWDLYSDTPQGGITGIENAVDGETITETGALVANAYLTDARKKTHTGNANSTTSATSKNTENNISNESENENTNRNTSGSSLQNIEGENTGSTVRSNTDDTTSITSTLGENTEDTTHHAETNDIKNEKENENTNRNTSGSSLQNIKGENTGNTVRSNTDDTTSITSTLGENTEDTTHHAETNDIKNEKENENTNRNTSGSSLQNIEGENTGNTVRSNIDDATSITSTLGENTTDTTHHAETCDLRNEKEHIYGKTANITYQKLIKEYRDNIININKMLIEELSSLFFGLW